MSKQQMIESRGIYHGLPVYPSRVSGLTAIITGANGISGHHMLRVLSESPQRWRRVICLSRRPPIIDNGLPSNAEHVPLDFLQDPKGIAKVLEEHNVEADHVFFFSYIQPPPNDGKPDIDELYRVNSLLLSNFLKALQLASITPKRFMLQTGGANYGIHLGPTKVPQEESDPRIVLRPLFYFNQEDMLGEYAKETNVEWHVHMPGAILGAVPDNAMNTAFPLAVYAAVNKHLGRSLEWPGDIASWQMPQSLSSAMMNAYQSEWAAILGPANQKYNTCDNSMFTFESVWPRIAGWYGIESVGPRDDDEYPIIQETAFVPRGYGPKAVARSKFSLVDWAKQPEVEKAWAELAAKYDLQQKKLVDVDRVFGFLDFILIMPSLYLMSMDKSARLGWYGTVNSTESLLEVFRDLAKINMIPPVPEAQDCFD